MLSIPSGIVLEKAAPDQICWISEKDQGFWTAPHAGTLAALLRKPATIEQLLNQFEETERRSASRTLDALLALGFLAISCESPHLSELCREFGVAAQSLERERWLKGATVLAGNQEIGAVVGAALREAGVRLTAEGGLQIVVLPDYLDGRIESLHRRFFESQKPWMLAKIEGAEVWIGPIFIHGRTACWRCLESRLREHRWLQSQMAPFLAGAPVAHTGADRLHAAAAWLAQESCRWLLEAPDTLEDTVWSFSWDRLRSARHAVMRRPQCPDCGAPKETAPIVLSAESAGPNLRARDSSAMLKMLEPLASPVTGILRRFEDLQLDLPAAMHAWGAVYCPAVPPREQRIEGSLVEPAVCAGLGASREEAQLACLAEAVERYSLQFRGDEPRVTGSFAALGEDAIHPNTVLLHSGAQTFNEHQPVEWFRGWSLTENRPRLLPLALTHLDYGVPEKWSTRDADSSGCAAGSSLTEAILHGLLELIERDALGIWWYNQVALAEANPNILDSQGAAILEHLRAAGWSVRLHDITTDLAIPTAVAVAVNREGAWLLGSAAHVEGSAAMTNALREVLLLCRSRPRLGPQPPYRAGGPVAMTTGTRGEIFDLSALVDSLCRNVAAAGHEVVVFDLTQPDLALPVVRVVAPGLRHKARRLASGRLYDVPVRLGWLTEAKPESSMAESLLL